MKKYLEVSEYKQEKFREICKKYVDKKCTLGVVLAFIKKEKWKVLLKKKNGKNNIRDVKKR